MAKRSDQPPGDKLDKASLADQAGKVASQAGRMAGQVRKEAIDQAGKVANQAGRMAGQAAGAVGRLGQALIMPLHLPGLKRPKNRPRRPGEAAGIDALPEIARRPEPGTIHLHCIDYSPGQMKAFDSDDADAVLATERPAGSRIRWINVDGLSPYVINRFKEVYNLHTLAAEDTLHVPQRPKVDYFDNFTFIVIRMLRLHEGRLLAEQVSIFLLPDTLITFQEETPGDVWDEVRQRLQVAGSRLRESGVDFLLYALLDACIDHAFPLLEYFGDMLEQLEVEVVRRPDPAILQRVHAIRRQLTLLRRVIWPMREVVDNLYRDDRKLFAETTKTFLRDVYDHGVQVMDIVETHREMAGGLTDLYMSAVSNRMNEIMKVLTIMASFFIPITFVAGVYGMNFVYLPEKDWRYGYPLFWLVVLVISGGLLAFFWRRGWLKGGD